MSKEKKIYDDDWMYSVDRLVVDWDIHRSFRHYKCIGTEKIPQHGAIILAPNHCCALMDPLAALAINHRKKVFVARADVFKKSFFRKILTFLKIMPINRRRDGIRTVLNTEATIEKSIEVLENDVWFCIMPEGTHRAMHSLLPIGKGIARIAYGAYERINDGRPVYIVPIGCEYGDYFRYRSSLLVQIGDPINVTQYIEQNKDMSEHDLMQGLREMTSEALKEKIVYIPDDEDYEAVWELSKLATGKIPERKLVERFHANREAVGKILDFKKKNPEKASSLFSRVLALNEQRKKKGISLTSINSRCRLLAALKYTLLSIIGLPFFLAYAVFDFPVWLLSELLVWNNKDKVFSNSLRCAAVVFLWSVIYVIWVIVFFFTLPFWWALAASLFIMPAPFFFYDFIECVRRLSSSWKYLFNNNIQKQYKDMSEELNKITK